MINNTNEKRLLWMDCLKTFSTFLIIIQHSISYEWVRLIDEPNYTWKIINFFFMLSKAGVPIFIMCSGIGMLQKERTINDIFRKNITSILKIYISWMLIYGIYHVYHLFCSGTATIRTVVNAIIKDILFGQYHTWFIVTLLGLYIITPFLFLIIQNKSLTQYFIVLSFVFTIILPYVGKYDYLSRLYTVITDTNMNFVVGYPLYYVVGYYISRIKLTTKRKFFSQVSLIISLTVAFLLSCSSAAVKGADCQTIYNDFSLFGFAISINIVLLFRIVFENDCPCCSVKHQQKIKYFIANISYYGVGIYLLHPLLLFLIEDLKGLKCLAGSIILWFLSLSIVKFISLSPFHALFLGVKRK